MTGSGLSVRAILLSILVVVAVTLVGYRHSQQRSVAENAGKTAHKKLDLLERLKQEANEEIAQEEVKKLPNVCLNMIVRDEADVILTALESVKDQISSYIICDTGSSDGTPDIAAKYLKEAGIPGVIKHHIWKNFAHNRNLCLDDGLAEIGDACDYWLLIDADQKFQSSQTLSKYLYARKIDSELYLAEEYTDEGGRPERTQRLLATHKPWTYKGAALEVVSFDFDKLEGKPRLPTKGHLPPDFSVLHQEKPGTETQKLERNAELLRQETLENPDNARTVFNLAIIYQTLGHTDLSVQAFCKRIGLEGWQEERYMSALEVAQVLDINHHSSTALTADTSAAIKDILDITIPSSSIPSLENAFRGFQFAHNILPYRKEAPYYLAKLYRVKENDADKCFQYATIAFEAKPDHEGTLNADPRISKLLVDEEMCICGLFAQGKESQGLEACDRLIGTLESMDPAPDSWLSELLARTMEKKKDYNPDQGSTSTVAAAEEQVDEGALLVRRPPREDGTVRVCLNMIAKDESADILKTLEAAKDQISSYIICDTGSSDGTPDIAAQYLKEAGIPGVIKHHIWKNFAHNRNLCLDDGLAEIGDACDYWLLIDADQVFVAKEGDKLGEYIASTNSEYDIYTLEEWAHSVVFFMRRVVRVGLPWKYLGATHEYIDLVADTTGKFMKISSLPTTFYTIHEANMGKGGRINKFERDIDLLYEDLREDPTNSRTVFYLANTLGAVGRIDEAMKYWCKRVLFGGWKEEMYMSALEVGKQLSVLFDNGNTTGIFSEDTKAALKKALGVSFGPDGEITLDTIAEAFLAANAILPYRKEAIYWLSKVYRTQLNDAAKCYEYASAARAAGPHHSETLFSDGVIVEYLIDEELCVCAYYIPGHEETGLEACARLESNLVMLEQSKEPGSWQYELLERTMDNKQTYMERTPSVAALPPSFPRPLKLLFTGGHLGIRGTEVAIFDYALWGQLFYEIEAHFAYPLPGYMEPDPNALHKFNTTFPNRVHFFPSAGFTGDLVENMAALDNLIRELGVDVLYYIQGSEYGYEISKVVPTIVHEVFFCNQGLGVKNKAISTFVHTSQGSACHGVVPHMAWMLNCTGDDMRAELGIPEDAMVFGWYGGHDAWDYSLTGYIAQVARSRGRDVFFLLQNVPPGPAEELKDVENVAILQPSTSMYHKCRFVSTTDAFIHIRLMGETFGLAVAEFSILGKPIITYSNPLHRFHLETLGDDAYIYTTYSEFYDYISTMTRESVQEKSGPKLAAHYQAYSPTSVMEVFNQEFFEGKLVERGDTLQRYKAENKQIFSKEEFEAHGITLYY